MSIRSVCDAIDELREACVELDVLHGMAFTEDDVDRYTRQAAEEKTWTLLDDLALIAAFDAAAARRAP